MRLPLLIIVTSLAFPAFSQVQEMDSLINSKLQLDSLNTRMPKLQAGDKLDSAQASFYNKADSLKKEFGSKLSNLDSSKAKIQSKIDSLSSLNLPTGKYTARLDSINRKREELAHSLDKKITDLKEKTVGKLNKLDLPPELKGKVSTVTQNIEGFKLPAKDLNIPSLNLPDNPLKSLDGLNTSMDSPLGKIGEIGKIDGLNNISGQLGDVSKITGQLGDVSKVTDQVGDISKVTEQAGGVTKDIQNVANGNLGDVKEVSGGLENKAAEVAGIDKLKEQSGGVLNNEMLTQAQNPQALKEQAVEQVQQAAVDHFAGKEQQLQAAMEQVAKLKRKYSSLNSLSEIPKRRPNPMRGKPLIERLLPGIGLQILKNADDIMTDFNPYVGYRFNERLTGGLGWNQRVAYNGHTGKFNPAARVFGPRIYTEFNLGKGFMPRGELEIQNTFVPPFVRHLSTDDRERQWVPGIFLGLKKEFRFIRKVKGTSMIMTRLYNPDHKSPYADVVNVRFGFEFPMKKKLKPSPASN